MPLKRLLGALGRIWALMARSGLDFEGFREVPGRVFEPPGTYFSRFLHACALAVVEFFRRAFWKALGVELGATRTTDLGIAFSSAFFSFVGTIELHRSNQITFLYYHSRVNCCRVLRICFYMRFFLLPSGAAVCA